jgi:polyisoprenoid-binding protein YceI
MKKNFVLIIIIFITSACFAQEKNTVTRSTITFQIKNLGINTGGTISGLKADIQFNPNNLASDTINASVDVNTINTDNDSRDDHLKGTDYFDAAHFPKIIMKSVSFRHKSGTNYTGTFNLTIKGKTKLIEIPFTYTEKGNTAIFKGNFKLNRLDFGIGESSMMLSNEVTVNIDAEINK